MPGAFRDSACSIVLALALAFVFTACGGGNSPGNSGATSLPTTATTALATTTSGSSTTDKGQGGALDVADWDGARFDIGGVRRIERAGGRIVVVYDRAQVNYGRELLSGTQLDDEPIIYANRDVQLVNENPQLRTFVVHPKATVYRLSNEEAVCDDEAEDPDPVAWERLTVEAAMEGELWQRYGQDSLIFDPEGRVISIRFSGGC